MVPVGGASRCTARMAVISSSSPGPYPKPCAALPGAAGEAFHSQPRALAYTATAAPVTPAVARTVPWPRHSAREPASRSASPTEQRRSANRNVGPQPRQATRSSADRLLVDLVGAAAPRGMRERLGLRADLRPRPELVFMASPSRPGSDHEPVGGLAVLAGTRMRVPASGWTLRRRLPRNVTSMGLPRPDAPQTGFRERDRRSHHDDARAGRSPDGMPIAKDDGTTRRPVTVSHPGSPPTRAALLYVKSHPLCVDIPGLFAKRE